MGDIILGKPEDAADAQRMLRALSGQPWHLLMLDEAQSVKNAQARAARAPVRRLGQQNAALHRRAAAPGGVRLAGRDPGRCMRQPRPVATTSR